MMGGTLPQESERRNEAGTCGDVGGPGAVGERAAHIARAVTLPLHIAPKPGLDC